MRARLHQQTHLSFAKTAHYYFFPVLITTEMARPSGQHVAGWVIEILSFIVRSIAWLRFIYFYFEQRGRMHIFLQDTLSLLQKSTSNALHACLFFSKERSSRRSSHGLTDACLSDCYLINLNPKELRLVGMKLVLYSSARWASSPLSQLMFDNRH
ncbi:hypothetical protein NC652_000731 [Populus alba x Populus x berolinensis]|nr:hypothetical protein NC652_000731 [Populus alba x Populus x berolinensis]